MKNKTNSTKRFHADIRTQRVFIEDEQVFFKKESQDIFFEDTRVAEWFPTDFKWIADRL